MERPDRGDDKWSKAAFIVSGDSFEPAEISETLGIESTSSGRKGEIRSTPQVKRPPRRDSIWILNSPLEDGRPLQDHLQWLLDKLESKTDAVREVSKSYKATFFCGFSSENGQGGCTFDADLIARLGRLGLPIVLNLYPPGPIPEQNRTASSRQGEEVDA